MSIIWVFLSSFKVFWCFFFVFVFFEIITLQMLDDSIRTKKEEKKIKNTKIKNNREQNTQVQ